MPSLLQAAVTDLRESARCRRILCWLPAVVITLLVLWPTLLFAPGRDQAVFAFVGRTIAAGGMPYRDAWDLKPPGIYLAYAALAVGSPGSGFPWLMLRVFDVAVAAATAVLLSALARRWIGPEVAWAAVAWYCALYLHSGFWSLAQAEAWANPLLLGAVLLCASEEKAPLRPWRALVAGGLTGIAAVLKVTTVLPAAPILAWAVLRRKEGRTAAAIAATAGAVAPVIACGAWLWAGGALDAYLEIQRDFVAPYARLNAPDLGKRVANVFGYTFGWAGKVWLPALAAVLGGLVVAREKRAGSGVAAVFLLGALAAVWLQNKYFGYHWQTVFPALALLAGAGTAAVLRKVRVPARAVPLAAAAVAIGWSVAVRWSDYRDGALFAAGRLPREAWLERFEAGRDYSYLADERAAGYVRRGTEAGDRVLVWGFEPLVYLLAERSAPTRFFFNVPVTVRFAPDAWRRELLAGLRHRPPRMVLVLRNDAIPWANGRTDDSAAQLNGWSELREWLEGGYRKDAELEDFTIYGRSGAPGVPVRVSSHWADGLSRPVPAGPGPRAR